MKNLIEELYKSKLVKVTGSYADGTQHNDSDIDFFVKEDKEFVEYEDRNIIKLISILNKFKIKWNSNLPNTISTIGSKNDLEKELEFSNIYRKRKNKLKRVNIYGFEFMTH